MRNFFWILAVFGLASIWLIESFEKGRFYEWKKAWAGPEEALVAAGLPAQIELIRQHADEAGWSVNCERETGELTLIEFTPTFWARAIDADQFYEGADKFNRYIQVVATSHKRLARPTGKGERCGEGPRELVSGTSAQFGAPEQMFLGFGAEDELLPYFELAERCELDGLRLRPLTQSEKSGIGGEISPEWLGLSIEVSKANGNQFICFGAIYMHEQMNL